MPLLCVIPARIGSTRLPEKPLRKVAGVPLVCAVARRVSALELGSATRIVVATDDRRIVDEVERAGFTAVMTDPGHRSGTERVAEVVEMPRFADVDLILNVQGDEPFVPADAVRGALDRVRAGDPIGTAAAPLPAEQVSDPHRVKVMIDQNGHAVNFSRAPLAAYEGAYSEYLQHLGIYSYTRSALLDWISWRPTPDEAIERLEQLRPLAHGIKIGVALLDREAPPGIDTEEDLHYAQAYATRQQFEVTA